MESGGNEAEFRRLLKAHIKKTRLGMYLSGDRINKAQSNIKKKCKYELDKEMKWFLE